MSRGAKADGIPLDEIDGRVLCRWETGGSPEYPIINRYSRAGYARWNSRAYAFSSEDIAKAVRKNVESGWAARLGRIYGPINGRIAGRKNVKNGHLKSMAGKAAEWRDANPEAAMAICRKGGRIGGRKNVESGHLARIQAMGGRIQGPIQGRKNVASGHWDRIRHHLTTEDGPKGNHIRWHVNRGIVNPDCPLCVADKTA